MNGNQSEVASFAASEVIFNVKKAAALDVGSREDSNYFADLRRSM
jgi:hypothetical protein